MDDRKFQPSDNARNYCPPREILADLALGKLPTETIIALGQHVETCAACQTTLESLDGLEDSLTTDLKAYAGTVPVAPWLEQQIREAKQISQLVWKKTESNEPEEPPSTRLRDYEILEQIGRGGMGAVYKALHTKLKRMVAIKVLSPARLRDAQFVARFQQEMEAVGRLDHPHLVRAYDAGEAEGQHYLAMEFVDGQNLRKLVREHGPLPVTDACEIICQAALGLQYAHEHGLVHRDIKPSNLMLTRDKTVKVLDLGLARLMNEAIPTGDMSSTGQIVGTCDFIAPEQGQDIRNVDARSDIYSLGCTLYFLLAGQAPFSGPKYDTFGKKLVAHAHEPIPPIQAIRPEVPSAVVAIIERMMAKAPEQRFQTAAEVAGALAAMVPSSSNKHRRPIVVFIIFMAVLMALAILFFSGTKSQQPPKPILLSVIQKGPQAGDRIVLEIKGVKYPFRWCSAGTFIMGSPAGEEERKASEKQHPVTLTQGFWMLETPVTQAMWKSVMENNPSHLQGEKFPVTQVSWHDCQGYVQALNRLNVAGAAAPAGYQFSLPTEAQREYACRAGTTTPYYFGNIPNSDQADNNGWDSLYRTMKGLKKTTAVGLHPANAWGLYDMLGNASEWCLDRYSKNYYDGGSMTDPVGPAKGKYRVLRGGICRSARRDFLPPSKRTEDVGLRLALVRKA